ncbi:MAG: clostripain-related cysteine peptidase [Reichenbachiella sp.]|uniref:clostripain-related cysteine peptidase n=1 Tax=Reichenbachiella sp. TaxID=2184521 RepID=UPI003262DBF8
MATKKEWTVLYLAQIKNATDSRYFKLFLKEITEVKLSSKIEVIFCINFKLKYVPPLIKDSLQNQIADKDKFTTLILKLTPNGTNNNGFSLIKEIPDFDITCPEDIGMHFIRLTKSQYIAKKYLLSTWDHGNGYSIFEGSRETKGVSLTMRGLNQAIKIGLGDKKKMDLLIMNNCWMQILDTPYALQNSVNYLVAPQDEVCLDFFDYKNIFRILGESPNISAHNLSSAAVHSVREEFECAIKDFSVSAMDLAEVDSFFKTLNSLAIGLKQEMNINTGQGDVNQDFIDKVGYHFIKARRLDTGNRYIDLYSLLNTLLKVLPSKEARLCQSLIDGYKKLVIAFQTNYNNNSQDEWHRPYGISLYCPYSLPSSREAMMMPRIFQPKISRHIKDTDFKQTDWGKLMTDIDDL